MTFLNLIPSIIPITKLCVTFAHLQNITIYHSLNLNLKQLNLQNQFQSIYGDQINLLPTMGPNISYHFYQFTRCTRVYLLKSKAKAQLSLQNFFLLDQIKFETSIKMIRSDNRAEFQMPSFYQSESTLHQLTCIATPRQNVLAERKHQHILNVDHALKFQSGLPMQYWFEFITTAVYLINRTPSSLFHYKSPFELLYNHKPSYSHFKVFGCL